jgi:hypothetical protein
MKLSLSINLLILTKKIFYFLIINRTENKNKYQDESSQIFEAKLKDLKKDIEK